MKKDLQKVVVRLNNAGEDAANNGVAISRKPLVYLAKASLKTRKTAVKKAVAAATKTGDDIWVPVYALGYDLSYHRNVEKLQGEDESIRLEHEFDARKCTPLFVSYREATNELCVMDGVRCLLAGIRNGIKKIKIRIFFDLSFEDEAEIFGEQNRNRLAIAPVDGHHARIAYQNRAASIVEGMCRELKITITPTRKGFARPLCAVVTATKIVENYGADAFAWILGTVEAALWLKDPLSAPTALNNYFLRALANTYAEGVALGESDKYLFRLVNVLRHVKPRLVDSYGIVHHPHMSRVGSLTVTLMDIARGDLKVKDFYKAA